MLPNLSRTCFPRPAGNTSLCEIRIQTAPLRTPWIPCFISIMGAMCLFNGKSIRISHTSNCTGIWSPPRPSNNCNLAIWSPSFAPCFARCLGSSSSWNSYCVAPAFACWSRRRCPAKLTPTHCPCFRVMWIIQSSTASWHVSESKPIKIPLPPFVLFVSFSWKKRWRKKGNIE